MLVLKLVLTPLVIGAVTLIGRRWGPRVAGMVVGLPVTTGPVSVFLASERGPAFAAQAATGAVAGLIGTGCFCAAYALAARRRAWPAALAAGLAALLAVTLLLRTAALTLPAAVALALGALVGLWAAVTRLTARDVAESRPAVRGPAPAWDLPGRIVVSTAMVAAVTAGAGLLGSRWSGVLSALPVFGAVLGVFTHRREGRSAAVALMRGLIIGCVSAVLFFAVVGTLLAPGEVATSYLTAALVAVVSGALVTQVTRPRPTAVPAVVGAPAATPVRRAA
jgi:hypothetical protein